MAEEGDSITESPVPQEALTTSVVEKAEEAMAASDRVLGLSKLPNWLSFWVPIVTALFSLVIAVFSLLISTQDPEVVLIMPSHVLMDISDRSDSAPYVPQNIYLQPNFVGTGNNSRVELINRMTLKIDRKELVLLLRSTGLSRATGSSPRGRTHFHCAHTHMMLTLRLCW